MSDLVLADRRICTMTDDAMAKVRSLEDALLSRPDLQVSMPTEHTIHGGMYARTVLVRKGVILAGALIVVPTILVVSGSATVYLGGESVQLHGYHVLAASARRRQAFLAHEDTYLTMLLVTDAQTVAQAEDTFTDEAHRLLSRQPGEVNHVLITGE